MSFFLLSLMTSCCAHREQVQVKRFQLLSIKDSLHQRKKTGKAALLEFRVNEMHQIPY